MGVLDNYRLLAGPLEPGEYRFDHAEAVPARPTDQELEWRVDHLRRYFDKDEDEIVVGPKAIREKVTNHGEVDWVIRVVAICRETRPAITQ
jgi:hypothetical protein